MILNILLLIALFFIGSAAKAVMDTLKSTLATSKLHDLVNNLWWDPKVSWKNKYKNGDTAQGEKFLGSTTVFVFLTDAWHFFQMIFLLSVFGITVVFSNIGAITPHWWIDLLIIFSSFTIPFELFYRFLNR